jgi:Zn-finger nucleic acid-binding protein
VLCPRDQVELQTETQRGIEVDRCPTCNGRWLDEGELSQLEATVPSTEEQRTATIEYSNRESTLPCPKCGALMTTFNYRAYSLELDGCVERHGLWLDAGEDSRVRDIIQERVEGLERSAKAEEGWDKFLDGLRGGGSFWDRLTGKG